MASSWYTKGLLEVVDGTIDLGNDTLKIMLVDGDYTFDADHEVVDNGGDDATDPSAQEISVAGYAPGWGGAGRKTATITMQANNADNRVDIAIADLTWTELAAGATVAAALLIKEGAEDDTTSRLIAYIEFDSALPTNGGDMQIDFAALGSGGNLRLTV